MPEKICMLSCENCGAAKYMDMVMPYPENLNTELLEEAVKCRRRCCGELDVVHLPDSTLPNLIIGQRMAEFNPE